MELSPRPSVFERTGRLQLAIRLIHMSNPGDKPLQSDAKAVERATVARPVVVVDHEIMGGRPCFAGTRVPAEIIIASVDEGIDWARLVAAYPFLTEEHVTAARAFLASPDGQRRPSPEFPLAFGGVIERKVVRPARLKQKPSPGLG